jgi:RNA polymerase sigma-70 factor (ECF subfamily)
MARRRPRDEGELIAALRAGDATWRAEAFICYEGMVRSVIRRVVGSGEDVDDLVIEVFLRFFEAAARMRCGGNLKGYLGAIALYTARGELRQRRRRRLAFSILAPETSSSAASDDPRARAALEQLRAILLEMRSVDRDAFVLRRIEGFGLSQVAELLGVSLSTARRRVRSGARFVEKRAARSALLSEYVRFEALAGC